MRTAGDVTNCFSGWTDMSPIAPRPVPLRMTLRRCFPITNAVEAVCCREILTAMQNAATYQESGFKFLHYGNVKKIGSHSSRHENSDVTRDGMVFAYDLANNIDVGPERKVNLAIVDTRPEAGRNTEALQIAHGFSQLMHLI